MFGREKAVIYMKEIMEGFNSIGVLEGNSANRLGFSSVEDEMHNRFIKYGEELGCRSYIDEVGNSFLAFDNEEEYILMGSHLDSVVDGGRYDGPAGVMAGLLLLKYIKEQNLNIPLRVVAFRCEESSNFGCCTIGSGLITGEEFKVSLPDLTSLNGEKLSDIFAKKGFSFTPKRISGVKEYLELHIEQARTLEDAGITLGIVDNIAGPRRLAVTINGMAEHSGATPMPLRHDAMCAAAEIILAVEKAGFCEVNSGSVATVGLVRNHPNVMNVVPGECYLGVDLRGTDIKSIDRMELLVREAVEEIIKRRKVSIEVKNIGGVPPVALSKRIADSLEASAKRCGISAKRMPSGATHDCATFADICDTGLVFIPCLKGISHNPLEDCKAEDIVMGAEVMLEYLKSNQ